MDNVTAPFARVFRRGFFFLFAQRKTFEVFKTSEVLSECPASVGMTRCADKAPRVTFSTSSRKHLGKFTFMQNFDRKEHWEKIYGTKSLNEVSWYQPVPTTSLDMVKLFNLPKDAKIIDVGGGDSLLVDHLLELGYTNVSVLDITENAIERAMERIGANSQHVKWIVADAATYVPNQQYDFWHDRAAFHFLTDKTEVNHYIQAISKGLKPNGKLVLGTFSTDGPLKCSGIEIQKYSEKSITEMLKPYFEKTNCFTINHETPSGSKQNFLFCSFQKFH